MNMRGLLTEYLLGHGAEINANVAYWQKLLRWRQRAFIEIAKLLQQ
jgi:hypothetical protein